MSTEKDLNYWKANAEEDYKQVPISVLRYITELETAVKNCSIPVVMPSLESESKTKDDMLLEILSPLGTEIPDPTGEYADLFAYLYDKISPIIRNEA